MQLKHRITIDLLEFIKTGKFDHIKIGQTKQWMLNNFPDPDDFQDSPDMHNNPIWRFGNIEFHFNKEELFLIHSDYIDTLDGGESLELKKWIFSEPQKLIFSYVLEQLNQQRINFKVEHQTFGELSAVNVTIIKSGVALGFSPPEGNEEEESELFLKRNQARDTNDFRLHGFSLTFS
jgi:hypothetical protein